MKISKANEIIQLILSALHGFSTLKVRYNKPAFEECGFFSLLFDDEDLYENSDLDIEDDLKKICDQYGLDPHWHSYRRLDLNDYDDI